MMRMMMTGLATSALLAMPAQAQFREGGVTSAAPTSAQARSNFWWRRFPGWRSGLLGGRRQAGHWRGHRRGGRRHPRQCHRRTRQPHARHFARRRGGCGRRFRDRLQAPEERSRQGRARRAGCARDRAETSTWSNADTGASGHVEVTNASATTGPALAGLKFADGVEPAANFSKIGDSFTTRAATNLARRPHAPPPTVRGTLPAGMKVWVAGASHQPALDARRRARRGAGLCLVEPADPIRHGRGIQLQDGDAERQPAGRSRTIRKLPGLQGGATAHGR